MNRLNARLCTFLSTADEVRDDPAPGEIHEESRSAECLEARRLPDSAPCRALRPSIGGEDLKQAASGCVAATPSILDAMGIAALICTPAAQVTFATAAARMLLGRGDTIRLAKQPSGSEVLVTNDRQSTLRLTRSISLAAAGLSPSIPGPSSACTLAVSRKDDAAPLVLAIAPFLGQASSSRMAVHTETTAAPPQALIVVSDPDAEDAEFALRIQSAFGLTPAEMRLAVALARGICRKAYARSIGVQPSTVKTQVTNLFAKTGTRRESDLVRILTSVPRLAWPGR